MVTVEYDPSFQKRVARIKDALVREKVKKHIEKIIKSPEIGKPMRFGRKGTREVYISSFRLSYLYVKEEEKLVILDLYHKDEQ